MEHGWLVSGAQLIDLTPVLSLAPDLAVFFSPGVIPSWSEPDGLENKLFPHVRFSGFGEDGMGHPGYRSAYEAAWQESSSTPSEEVSVRLTHELPEK